MKDSPVTEPNYASKILISVFFIMEIAQINNGKSAFFDTEIALMSNGKSACYIIEMTPCELWGKVNLIELRKDRSPHELGSLPRLWKLRPLNPFLKKAQQMGI